MAIRFNKFFLVAIAIAIATLVQHSSAQTTHVVGDSLGWTVPPNGAATYSNWAANKTFTVGDILVFNFVSGRHDVTLVTQSSFNACNTTSPLNRTTNSPANITLTTAGAHYYICSFPGHCLSGQKLTINVSATAPSPAPQPSSPPSPTPTRQPLTYVVGDALGWTVPPNTSVSYQNWARNKTFVFGDILGIEQESAEPGIFRPVFNYVTGAHNVAEVTKAAYDSCNSSTTLSKATNSPTRITLTKPGEHYYICTIPNHCSLGQKLAVNVTGSSSTGPSASPTPTTQSPPNNSAKSLGAAASLFTTLLAIVVALLY